MHVFLEAKVLDLRCWSRSMTEPFFKNTQTRKQQSKNIDSAPISSTRGVVGWMRHSPKLGRQGLQIREDLMNDFSWKNG